MGGMYAAPPIAPSAACCASASATIAKPQS
jgi:hypothetical protein